MEPIILPDYLKYGISIYVPALTDVVRGYADIAISYSISNPLYRDLGCNDPVIPLWNKCIVYDPAGMRFDYLRAGALEVGSYNITMNILGQDGLKYTGAQTYTLDKPTDSLYIGLPYSIYPPIVFSHA